MKMIYLKNFRQIEDPSKSLRDIADWRDLSQATLRTTYATTKINQLDWFKKIVNNNHDQYYFIFDAENDGLIGYCGLDKMHEINRTAEISCLISPEKWENGHGKDAIEKLLMIGFNQFNLNCIFGECYNTTTNIDFWEKCGFTIEGVLKQRKYWQGQYFDSYSFSMTREYFLKFNDKILLKDL